MLSEHFSWTKTSSTTSVMIELVETLLLGPIYTNKDLLQTDGAGL